MCHLRFCVSKHNNSSNNEQNCANWDHLNHEQHVCSFISVIGSKIHSNCTIIAHLTSSIHHHPFATCLNTFELRNRVRTTKYHLLREGRYYPLTASLRGLDSSVLTDLYLFLFRRTNVRRPNVHLIATVRMDLEKKAFDVNATSDSPERLATRVSEIIYCTLFYFISFILFIFSYFLVDYDC